MRFNPAPPEKNRFEHYTVVCPGSEDPSGEINSYLREVKEKLIDDALLVGVITDQYPTTVAFNADFVCMPTSEYQDKTRQAYDDGCKIVAQARINQGFDPATDDRVEVLEKVKRMAELACETELSDEVRNHLVERVISYQQGISASLADTEEGLRELLNEKIAQIAKDDERYRQVMTVTADAIRLLNITLADQVGDGDEA